MQSRMPETKNKQKQWEWNLQPHSPTQKKKNHSPCQMNKKQWMPMGKRQGLFRISCVLCSQQKIHQIYTVSTVAQPEMQFHPETPRKVLGRLIQFILTNLLIFVFSIQEISGDRIIQRCLRYLNPEMLSISIPIYFYLIVLFLYEF